MPYFVPIAPVASPLALGKQAAAVVLPQNSANNAHCRHTRSTTGAGGGADTFPHPVTGRSVIRTSSPPSYSAEAVALMHPLASRAVAV